MEPHARTADAGDMTVSCAQVRGGNGAIDTPITLPGLSGVLRSTPSDGGRGGDVYYLSVCASGLLTRICLADVVGHGERVSDVAQAMHRLLERFVSRPDHRRILRDLNRSLVPFGLDAMTTAAIFTYYPPSRALSFTYAGHPPGWYFRARDRRWSRLVPEKPAPESSSELVNGVLGVSDSVAFTRSRVTAEDGDRLLLVTDGVLETPSPSRELFGSSRLESVLALHRDEAPGALASRIVEALTAHHRSAELEHDDVTILLLEVVDNPAGPALWHVLRNRVLRPLGLAEG